jgi:hypothetical protein
VVLVAAALQVVTVILVLAQPQAVAQVEHGIQQLPVVQAEVGVVAEIVLLTAADLEYQAAQELQVKDFQVDRVYASTMTAKIHTTAVVAVEQAAQD